MVALNGAGLVFLTVAPTVAVQVVAISSRRAAHSIFGKPNMPIFSRKAHY